MENISLEKLEFNKILLKLSEFAITDKAKKSCIDLLPSNNKSKIEKILAETSEALVLLYRKGNIPISELNNIDAHILALKNQNFLSIKSLLEINQVLKISRELKEYYFNEQLNKTDILTNYFNNLYTNTRIENKISNSIIDENSLDDRASENLYKIRQEIKNTQKSIKGKLQSLLSSKYLQEPIITVRQNRFVVPVKSEYKTEIKGFIHDTSTSGATIFVEPLSVFELNNKISDLTNQENIEIEKILQKLSSLFFDITSELENTYNLICMLDFIFAKAKYSRFLDGNCPQINNKKLITLEKARHPLLNKEIAVPIDLEIGKNFSTLLITGPNTGGKTVTLKTVGLLTAMAMSGLHIPASEKSSIYVFDNIFADIGDEQNILESLSTFSSHIKNIVHILNNSTDQSLVLLDELGSGTDPVEGSHLALSILESLKEKGIITLATTHYQELKEYALITESVENASCEFDIETLSPTYKLLIGVPGKSNAFEISKKLGLPSEILDKAKNSINSNTAKLEDLLKEIYDNKSKIESEKEKIYKNSKEIESIKVDLITQKNELEKNRKEYINKYKQEAKEILLEAKEEANAIIKEMNDEKNNSSKAHSLRKKLNEKISEFSSSENSDEQYEEINESEITPGKIVYVPSFSKNGTILSYPNQSKKVNIQIDNIKTTLSISQIAPAKQINKNKEISKKEFSNFVPKQVSTELNVIGLNVEEANLLVDKFLDTSAISKLETVRIVHGKGTGTLGKGIQKYLKNHPHVKSYRYGTYGEGEMGVTVVELK